MTLVRGCYCEEWEEESEEDGSEILHFAGFACVQCIKDA